MSASCPRLLARLRSPLSADACSARLARLASRSSSGRCLSSVSVSEPSQPSQPSHPSGLTLTGGGRGMGLDIPPSRSPLWKPSPLPSFLNRYYYLFRAMGVFGRSATMGGNSEAIMRSIEEQATQEVWWEALRLPRTWIAEHAMITLHVWMFHNRFKVDYNVSGEFNGRRSQEQLFERLWEDTTLRIRNAGVRVGGGCGRGAQGETLGLNRLRTCARAI